MPFEMQSCQIHGKDSNKPHFVSAEMESVQYLIEPDDTVSTQLFLTLNTVLSKDFKLFSYVIKVFHQIQALPWVMCSEAISFC